MLDERAYRRLDRANTVALGSMRAGGGTTGEGGLTLRRGNDQSPVGARVPRRKAREGGDGRRQQRADSRVDLVVHRHLTGIGILQTIGIILLVVGAFLWILGAMGRRLAAVGTTGSARAHHPLIR
jgi:hypothetical protein